jgi:O-antigen/teichoic acid export membrane protein
LYKTISKNVVVAILHTLTSLLIYFSASILIKDKSQLDCVFIALSIPSFLLIIWSGSISYQLTPIIVSQNKDSTINYVFIKTLAFKLLIYILILSTALWLAKDFLVTILAPGFESEKKEYVLELIKYSILLTPIQLLNSTFNSLFISLRRNIFASSTYLIGTVFTLILVYLFKENISSQMFIVFIITGNLLTFIRFSLMYYRKFIQVETNKVYEKINYNIIFKELFYISLILIFSRSIFLIQNAFASNMKNGTITLLTYSNYIVSLLISILVTPILNIFYSQNCEDWNKKQTVKLFANFKFGFILIILSSLLCISLLFYFKSFLNPIIKIYSAKLLFEFDINIILLLSLSISCLISAAFIGRLYYIAGLFRLINILDLIAVFIYVVCTYLSTKYLGFIGLYFSFFIYTFSIVATYCFFLTKKIGFNFQFETKLKKVLYHFILLLIFSISINFIHISLIVKTLVGIIIFALGIFKIFNFTNHELKSNLSIKNNEIS